MAETRNIWNVVCCGIGFFLVFVSFGTCQNIVAEAFDQKHYNSLGFYTVALIYVFYAITSLTFPFLVEKLGGVRSMSVGSFCYFVWVLSGVLPIYLEKTPMVETVVWIIMIITGSINGMGASLLWIGQGKYVSQCCLYFSIIWLFCSLSSIFGNLFASIMLRITTQTNLFILMSLISLAASICLGVLRTPKEIGTICDILCESANDSNQSSDKLLSDELQEFASTEHKNNQISLKSTLSLLFDTKMLKMTCLMLNAGLIGAIVAGFIPKVVANVVEQEDKLIKVINCLFVFGIGQIVGSVTIGKVIDKLGDRFAILFIMAVSISSFVTMLFAHLLESFTFFWYISSFALGVTGVCMNTYNGVVVGSEFEKQSEAFGCMNFSQSYIVFLVLIAESLIKHPDQILEQRLFIIVCGVFGIVGCLIALTFPFKQKIKGVEAANNQKEIELM